MSGFGLAVLVTVVLLGSEQCVAAPSIDSVVLDTSTLPNLVTISGSALCSTKACRKAPEVRIGGSLAPIFGTVSETLLRVNWTPSLPGTYAVLVKHAKGSVRFSITTGTIGATGTTGPQGPKGDRGDVGPAGPDGQKGDTGPQGQPGVPGPAGASLNWLQVTEASVQANRNTGYLAMRDSEPVVITLPGNPVIGDIIRVTGVSTGGWKIAQNSGQSIESKNLGEPAWIPRDSARIWVSVASSSDGTKLIAAEQGSDLSHPGRLYVSTNSGISWIPTGPPGSWISVASSANGQKLIAAANAFGMGGQLYISSDGGQTWDARESARTWSQVASSADGVRMAAAAIDRSQACGGSQIYLSSDSGESWTPHGEIRNWTAIASSADGLKLIAAADQCGIYEVYTSGDGGETWTKQTFSEVGFQSIASSDDGQNLVAAAGGRLYTSSDGGVTWNARDVVRAWFSLASSSDGRKLAAAVFQGQIYTSDDSGASWKPRAFAGNWQAITSSSDGNEVVAVIAGGQIFTSSGWNSTTSGTSGFLSGDQGDAVELQYLGGGQFGILSSSGSISAQ